MTTALEDTINTVIPAGTATVSLDDLRDDVLLPMATGAQWITEVQSFLGAATIAAGLTAVGLGSASTPTFAGVNLTTLTVNTNVLVVTSGSKVGIGTATPSYLLDVSGNLRATTAYLTNVLQTTSDGSDNQVLSIGGGGAATSYRGAYVQLGGNESSKAGQIVAYGGDVADGGVILRGAGTVDTNYRGGLSFYGGVSQSTGAYVLLYGNAHATLAGALYINSGLGNVLIGAGTADGTDNKYVQIVGGGGLATSRGAIFRVNGNEAANGGLIQMMGGDVADGGVQIMGAGTADSTYRGASAFYGGISQATGASVLAYGNAHATLAGNLYLTAGSAGIVYVYPLTSDGTDNKAVQIGGGGAVGSSRGAYAIINGNEASPAGRLQLYGGDVADGGVVLRGAGTTDTNYRGASAVYGGVSTATGGYVLAYGNAHGSSPGQMLISSGTGDMSLLLGTSDGSDNKGLYLAAGSTVSATRGAILALYGNEHATNPGELVGTSGLGGGITFYPATNDTADNRSLRLAGGGGFSGARGAQLLLYGNENASAGGASLIAGESGNVSIYVATTDGSDSRAVFLAGGGAVNDNSRGAYVSIYGNEHATNPGRLIFGAGASSAIHMAGNVLASVDNTYTLGGASNRFSTVYAATGTINTSDATEKQWRGGMSDTEYAVAARIANGIGVFQWLDAIAEKGEDGARYHVGVTAQTVQAAFIAEELDPTRYGAWCLDAVVHDDGSTSTRQGLRFDQLAMFMIAAGLRKIHAVETRVAALEPA